MMERPPTCGRANRRCNEPWLKARCRWRPPVALAFARSGRGEDELEPLPPPPADAASRRGPPRSTGGGHPGGRRLSGQARRLVGDSGTGWTDAPTSPSAGQRLGLPWRSSPANRRFVATPQSRRDLLSASTASWRCGWRSRPWAGGTPPRIIERRWPGLDAGRHRAPRAQPGSSTHDGGGGGHQLQRDAKTPLAVTVGPAEVFFHCAFCFLDRSCRSLGARANVQIPINLATAAASRLHRPSTTRASAGPAHRCSAVQQHRRSGSSPALRRPARRDQVSFIAQERP